MLLAPETAGGSVRARSKPTAPASVGRFMQPDPIGYDDGMNLYGYAGGDPVNRVDPSGTSCREIRISWHWYTPSGGYIGPTGEPDDVYTICEPGHVPRNNHHVGGGGGGGSDSADEESKTCSSDSEFRRALANPDIRSALEEARRLGHNFVDPYGHRMVVEYGFWASQRISDGAYVPGKLFTDGDPEGLNAYARRPSWLGNRITGFYRASMFMHYHPGWGRGLSIPDIRFSDHWNVRIVAMNQAGETFCHVPK